MDFKNLWEQFAEAGKLVLPEAKIDFKELPWNNHPTFVGVQLKHIITAQDTEGQFSFHLVRIAPHKKIGNHAHAQQLETHEIIDGVGICNTKGTKIDYMPGVLTVFPMKQEHEIIAGAEGLFLFAKFIPALT